MRRGLALAILGLLFIQFLPTIADVVTTSATPEPMVTSAPSAEPTTTSSPQPESTENSSSQAEPAPSSSYIYVNTSETPTPRSFVASSQDATIRLPATFPVDPRATSVKIAPIKISASGDVLLCLSTTASSMWLMGGTDGVLLEGNGTPQLRLSGPAEEIRSLLNSGAGLRVGAATRVQGSVVTIKVLNLMEPTLDEELCDQAEKVATSLVTPLGLGMYTVKNPVPIK